MQRSAGDAGHSQQGKRLAPSIETPSRFFAGTADPSLPDASGSLTRFSTSGAEDPRAPSVRPEPPTPLLELFQLTRLRWPFSIRG